ncbi:MAG: hypothetical protein K6G44_00850, partial [Lentisphaeria bacterium]|nr:hypothetical protein [Lentisphaeria bacterium]
MKNYLASLLLLVALSMRANAYTGGTVSATIGNSSNSYTATLLVNGTTESYSGLTLSATGSDSNVVTVVNGGNLTLTNCTINKSGSGGDDDKYNFYGLNSAVVAIGSGSTITLVNCTITCASTSKGANAVFASDEAEITVTGLTVTTSANSSRGLHATYDGVITATDVSITTAGEHCAAIATDRGGGTVTVLSSATTGQTNTLTTNGSDSPCIYSTGAISVTGATGTATKSEAVVVEGKNSVAVDRCVLSGTPSRSSRVGCIMLYQSTSGDAADGDAASDKSTLTASDTSFTLGSTSAVPFIYVVNTTASVTLTDCAATFSGSDYFAYGQVDPNGQWGTGGGNAAITLSGSASVNGISNPEAEDLSVYTDASSTITITTDYDEAVVTYAVTVVNGSADVAEASEGATVTITAADPEDGKVFAGWTTDDGVVFEDASSSVTSFTMPAKAVTVTATYEDEAVVTYAVTVVNGSADVAEASEGATVTITAADPEDGKVFAGWTTD